MAWGVPPPEPLAEPPDPTWEAKIRQEELSRRVEAQERLETRFYWTAANGGRQALLDGQGHLVARLAEADLAITPETLEWIAGLPPDLEIFPVESRILPSAIEAAEAGAKAAVRGAFRGRSKQAALAETPLDLETPVAGVVVPPAVKEEALEGLSAQIHQRAEIKRHLVRLWKMRLSGNFPEECASSNGRWAKLAWLTFVGFSMPPVFVDARRWDARKALSDELELTKTGLEVAHLQATLEVARRVARSSEARN